jgi:A/G-specific adenine glycosylase
MEIKDFKQKVYDFYAAHGRGELPWRHQINPYNVLVSEVMLQQTQAERVVPKYLEFLKAFPSVESLAKAEVSEVLKLWQGLGYNRRALSLQKCAVQVSREGFPERVEELQKLPGIGPYTASAIRAFAYNKPVVMIETNIRRVFLHHFFPDVQEVSDTELLPLIEETLDTSHPRDWYYALMDYGSWLAKTYPNANRRSKHYSKQSKFEGSLRQLRGKLLKLFLEDRKWDTSQLLEATGDTPERLRQALLSLEKEGFPIPGNLGRI